MSFFRDFKKEMQKMRWAKKKEVIDGTLGVLVVSVIVLIYFFIIDMGILAIKNIWSGVF